jgi:putative protein-disulfide isomerase
MEFNMNKPVLYHVYDPMCSWCWGYRKTWLKLSNALEADGIIIQYQLGGLAPDSDVLMPAELQQTLQNIWRRIQQQLGTEFNFDFWSQCKPQRSTYPACRACLIARESGKEKEMLFAIQEAYYLQAKNPSLNSVLIDLAEKIGLNKVAFKEQLNVDTTHQKLLQEISISHQLPIQGFPSLVLSINDKVMPIELNYLDWQATYDHISKIVNA